MKFPFVNRQQISELDRLMVERFRIPVSMMMEQAGYRIAEFVRSVNRKNKPVVICVGKGNNGGDGIAAARHLLNFGYEPKLFLVSEDIKGEPLEHLNVARTLGIPLIARKNLEEETFGCGTIVDCLIGYNLSGAPRPPFDEVIRIINRSGKPIISVDIPSGIDTDKGPIHSDYIHATHILFLSLPKIGCLEVGAEKFVGDIGVPKALYPLIGIEAKNYFEKRGIEKID